MRNEGRGGNKVEGSIRGEVRLGEAGSERSSSLRRIITLPHHTAGSSDLAPAPKKENKSTKRRKEKDRKKNTGKPSPSVRR